MSFSIFPINATNCSLPVLVLGVGYEDNQPHVLRKEGFPLPQIFVCTSGEGTLKVNERDYTIKRGSFFYLMPNIPHEYYGNTDKWELIWIVFSGNQLDNILTELKFNSSIVGTLNNTDKIEASLKRIFVALKAEDDLGKYISSSILYEILVDFYTMLHRKHGDEISEGSSLMNTIKLYIDEHYNQNITLEVLADLVNITPQYLCKLFRRHLDLRPFQYIAMKRIQHAKIMLSDSTLSINEIAHLVGYSDCSYFCSIFKRYESISPSEFRGLKFNGYKYEE